MPLLLAAIISLCAIAPGYAAPELRWPETSAFAEYQVAAPGLPAGSRETCPKGKLRDTDSYPDSPPAVREVSEVGAETLPLAADDLDRSGIIEILKTDLSYWNARPDSAKVQLGPDFFDAPRMRRTINALLEIFGSDMPSEELLKALRSRFRVYRASADDGTGKTVITGYYEAEIKVSKTRDAKHNYAVHLKPADLVKTTPEMNADFDYGRYDEAGQLVRHYTRQEIHAGALAGQGLELVWAEHPSHIMLLQIQGSGYCACPTATTCARASTEPTAGPSAACRKYS